MLDVMSVHLMYPSGIEATERAQKGHGTNQISHCWFGRVGGTVALTALYCSIHADLFSKAHAHFLYFF